MAGLNKRSIQFSQKWNAVQLNVPAELRPKIGLKATIQADKNRKPGLSYT